MGVLEGLILRKTSAIRAAVFDGSLYGNIPVSFSGGDYNYFYKFYPLEYADKFLGGSSINFQCQIRTSIDKTIGVFTDGISSRINTTNDYNLNQINTLYVERIGTNLNITLNGVLSTGVVSQSSVTINTIIIATRLAHDFKFIGYVLEYNFTNSSSVELINLDVANGTANIIPNLVGNDMIWFPSGSGTYVDV